MYEYYVYIMSNKTNKVLYTGVTNDIARRAYEHRLGDTPGFTQKYNVTKLLYIEVFNDIYDAINREKQIKGWTHQKKINLIKTSNPDFIDLYAHL